MILGALREGRSTSPAHKDAFNSLISDLKRKIRIGIESQLMIIVQLQGPGSDLGNIKRSILRKMRWRGMT
jgi:hypothetical protein